MMEFNQDTTLPKTMDPDKRGKMSTGHLSKPRRHSCQAIALRYTTDNKFLGKVPHFMSTLRKKVEPKWLHPGAVLENGATLEGGAVFSLNNHV